MIEELSAAKLYNCAGFRGLLPVNSQPAMRDQHRLGVVCKKIVLSRKAKRTPVFAFIIFTITGTIMLQAIDS